MMVDVRGQRDRKPSKAVKAFRKEITLNRQEQSSKKALAPKKKAADEDEVQRSTARFCN